MIEYAEIFALISFGIVCLAVALRALIGGDW